MDEVSIPRAILRELCWVFVEEVDGNAPNDFSVKTYKWAKETLNLLDGEGEI